MPELHGDTQRCQILGVKVKLDLGEATGSYEFNNDEQTIVFANQFWDTMFNESGKIHPFGDVVLDGINLDIEGGNPYNYAAFVYHFRILRREASKSASTSNNNRVTVLCRQHVKYVLSL